MTEVILHVYDVTNCASQETNNTILQINRIFKDRIGLGGIFHSAVQIYGGTEWSFGFCDEGTGVYSCPSGKNPIYAYRESITLGKTDHSIFKVNLILRELSREWSGSSYDLLSRNCNHFCNEFCQRLGVSGIPGWVNRFAHAGDAAMELAENTAFQFRRAKAEILSASKVAYRFLMGSSDDSLQSPKSPGNENGDSPTFQASLLKDLIPAGEKPSCSSEVEDQEANILHCVHHQDEEVSIRSNS